MQIQFQFKRAVWHQITSNARNRAFWISSTYKQSLPLSWFVKKNHGFFQIYNFPIDRVLENTFATFTDNSHQPKYFLASIQI